MDKELLFILIIILTVVINIFKAIKKKREQNKPAATPTPSAGQDSAELQEILRKMFGDNRQEIPIEQSMEAESLETLSPMGGSMEDIEQYNFHSPEYSRSSFDTMEGFDVTPSVSAAPVRHQETEIAVVKTHPAIRHFNLKTAVIYNAILIRPYH